MDFLVRGFCDAAGRAELLTAAHWNLGGLRSVTLAGIEEQLSLSVLSAPGLGLLSKQQENGPGGDIWAGFGVCAGDSTK